MKKKLFVSAECHNWGLMGPGSWRTVTWSIFDDGSFRKITKYNYDKPEKNSFIELLKGRDEILNGRIQNELLLRMKSILDEEWIDDSTNSSACDGVAWEITRFDQTGGVVKKMNLRYIYGQPIEKFITMLEAY